MKADNRAAEMITSMAESIPVRVISEPLVSYGKKSLYADALSAMRVSGFDVMGVTDASGHVIGFIDAKATADGTCGDAKHLRMIPPEMLVTDSMPLAEAGFLVARSRRIFILERNKITSIVTRADLQKAPVRMMIFGTITVLEMHLTDVLRREWPGEEWHEYGPFTPKQVTAIEAAFGQAQKRNDETDVFGCMNLYDKCLLACATDNVVASLRTKGFDDLESKLAAIRTLRNAVAHGTSLVASNRSWNKVLHIAVTAQHLAQALESMLERDTGAQS